jgi:hypothetical protein
VRRSCKCGNEHSGSMKCWETNDGYRTGGLFISDQLHVVSWLAGWLIKYINVVLNLFLKRHCLSVPPKYNIMLTTPPSQKYFSEIVHSGSLLNYLHDNNNY